VSCFAEALEHYAAFGEAGLLNPEDIAASVVHALRQPDHVAVDEIWWSPTTSLCEPALQV